MSKELCLTCARCRIGNTSTPNHYCSGNNTSCTIYYEVKPLYEQIAALSAALEQAKERERILLTWFGYTLRTIFDEYDEPTSVNDIVTMLRDEVPDNLIKEVMNHD